MNITEKCGCGASIIVADGTLGSTTATTMLRDWRAQHRHSVNAFSREAPPPAPAEPKMTPGTSMKLVVPSDAEVFAWGGAKFDPPIWVEGGKTYEFWIDADGIPAAKMVDDGSLVAAPSVTTDLRRDLG